MLPSLSPWRAIRKVNPKKLKKGDRFIRQDGRINCAGIIVEPFDKAFGEEVVWVRSYRCLWSEQWSDESGDSVCMVLREQDRWYLAERDPSYPSAQEFESMGTPYASCDSVEIALWNLATIERHDVIDRSDALKALQKYRESCDQLSEYETSHTEVVDLLRNLVGSFDATESSARYPELDDARQYLFRCSTK